MEQFILNYLTNLGYLVMPVMAIVVGHNILLRLFGRMIGDNTVTRFVYYVLGIVGVPLHEISHAFTAWLFGHKVTQVKLYGVGEGGLSGHVLHSWNPRSIYQRQGLFWIGISPLIVTILAVNMIVDTPVELGPLEGWRSVAWYELLAVGMVAFYCIPSIADLKNAVKGAVVVALVAPILMLMAPYVGFVGMEKIVATYWSCLWGVLLFSMSGWLIFINLSLLEIGIKKTYRLFW